MAAVAAGCQPLPESISNKTAGAPVTTTGASWAVSFMTWRLSEYWVEMTGPNARSGWSSSLVPEPVNSWNQKRDVPDPGWDHSPMCYPGRYRTPR